MIRFCCYLALMILTSGCLLNSRKNTADSLNGTWRLYDIEPQGSGSSFSEIANLKRLVKDGNVLSFFRDGSYTELNGDGDYKSGRFSFSKRMLQRGDGQQESGPVEVQFDRTKNGKQILSLLNTEHKVALKYIKDADEGTDYRDAPFYTANNLWRLKPNAPEDSSQQVARLTNYLKHVALILKAAKESKGDVVSFEFSQGPVKIYNGGIGIHPFEVVPQGWKNSFYTEAEALSAYRKYQDYLRTSSYKGAGTGDWVEDDFNILLSIYADLQQEVKTKY